MGVETGSAVGRSLPDAPRKGDDSLPEHPEGVPSL